MRMQFQSLAPTPSQRAPDRRLLQPRKGRLQMTEKALEVAKKDKACRASQMKLFWVFQVSAA